MLNGEIIAVCSQIHTKHTQQNAEVVDALAKFAKTTVMCACLSVHLHGATRIPLDVFV